MDEADAFLAEDSESRARLQAVSELIEGFETPYGMELLATVHWVATDVSPGSTAPAADTDDAIRSVHAWNPRKRSVFKPEHVRVAWARLSETGWIQRPTS